ncbi:Endonuclease/exonuclease/phosphatase [Pseudocohnilembus persalinus]|uniref:Endonuclease/exonuclease/phosphatase n=1 Tax=Pseudocohnilembus persalinus TaxID=266149 RepID=A0A0V0Q925_PSEPJ|nr:Endonuclease/exonuclease/phosphatase [Pseudocohnilembus persalinus]|eukprot:KRW98677.1 Endonuclease/exonuclease/phosphatase [Pseudocohnilembus persalinus]
MYYKKNIKQRFDNSNQSIIVLQLHLFAYEEKFLVRQNQMKEIHEFLTRLKKNPEILEKNEEILMYLKSALQNNNIVAQGDLNLHNNIENNYIYQTGFIDTWIEKHGLGKQSEEQGYTWDPTQNSMIRMILPFDNRRMRLDRILLRQESNYLFRSFLFGS